jgi:hypothetical protein
MNVDDLDVDPAGLSDEQVAFAEAIRAFSHREAGVEIHDGGVLLHLSLADRAAEA